MAKHKKRGRPPKKENINKIKKIKEPGFIDIYKNYIYAGLCLILSLIFVFAFANAAGTIGNNLESFFYYLFGYAVYLIPVVFLLASALLLWRDNPYKNKEKYIGFLLIAFLLEASAIFGIAELKFMGSEGFDFGYSGLGGFVGYIISLIIMKGFGFWVTFSMLVILTSITLIILLEPLFSKLKENRADDEDEYEEEEEVIIEKTKKPAIKEKEDVKVKIPLIPIFKKKQEILKKDDVKKEEEFKVIQRKTYAPYEAPPLSILSNKTAKPESGDIKFNSNTIKRTLHNFGIPVEMDEVNVGPTVSQYTLKPAEGVKLSKITNLANNLALDLATPSIRIEAPIPGRSLVGIEIPNKKRVPVGLREMLASKEFKESDSPLLFALGKDVRGDLVYADLADMPHLLVAGTTGSGKSICLNCIILSLVYRNGPDDMKFVMVDPKKVEFPVYNPINHLMCPVISNADETIIALKWLVGEMERRFEVLRDAGNRDILTYNKKWKEGMEKMPYIVVIIDELADLMMARGKEIESYVVRLAQKARAVGIHLILATQRPSVEVITGLIKANISSRIGLKVASQIDSRTMLDSGGAEKLLGKGDLLFQSKDSSNLRRIQGPFVSETEIKDVVNFIEVRKVKEEAENPEKYLELEKEEDNSLKAVLEEAQSSPETQMDQFLSDEDPLYNQAKQIVIQTRKASTSFMQRKLGVGYARAARLIDSLEERGIVGPQEGSRQREVYVKDKD
ncbi:MAG TPA: DNA translocase FtsK 4TM domain-containing protein [Candidatus Pacearchaeota archaeon]|nr:DNA translocase FtsK 4TM domain-containing protein [Candidatus Pacearchaeota archaeon]